MVRSCFVSLFFFLLYTVSFRNQTKSPEWQRESKTPSAFKVLAAVWTGGAQQRHGCGCLSSQCTTSTSSTVLYVRSTWLLLKYSGVWANKAIIIERPPYAYCMATWGGLCASGHRAVQVLGWGWGRSRGGRSRASKRRVLVN